MGLANELSKRNLIIEKIKVKQDEMAGKSNKDLLDKITAATKERNSILTQFTNKQEQLRNETDPVQMKIIHEELVVLCNKLRENEELLNNLNKELSDSNKNNALKSEEQHKVELDKLFDDLDKNTNDVAKAREDDRITAEKESKDNKYKGIDPVYPEMPEYEKVWIDEDFGIYINYPKKAVLTSCMSCFFGSGMATIPENFPIKKEDVFKTVSNKDQPGLPTLLNTFIDTLIKAVGQGFVKNFFFFKNTIDLLAGLQLGELLGTYIPGIPKVIKDIQLLLTDPQGWMFKKMMGPLFDINIPIPEFKFDLGAIVPMLPFSIKIPKIDPMGFFDGDTPFNINADPTKISSNWMGDIVSKAKDMEKEYEKKFQDIKNKKLSDFNTKIQDLEKKLNKFNKFSSLREKAEGLVNNLTIKYEQMKTEFDQLKSTYSPEELLSKTKLLDNTLAKLNSEKDKFTNFLNSEKMEQDLLDKLDLNSISNELGNLRGLKDELINQPNVSMKQFAKRSLMMSYEQSLGNFSNDLTLKMTKLYDSGINIFDNNITSNLQKLGHDFTSDKFAGKLLSMKDKFGIKFNDINQMNIMQNVGINLNDSNVLSKLNSLKTFKIDMNDLKNAKILNNLGMNLNSDKLFKMLPKLNDIGINLNDSVLMEKMQTIGFNFNNPNLVTQLEKVKK